MGAGDEGVGAGREGVRRQGRVEPEVGAPRGIHDEGDAVPVGDRGQRAHLTHRADVGRVADEHGAGVGCTGECGLEGCSRDTRGQSVGRVDLGTHPDRVEPGEHEAEEHRAVQGAGHDDPVAGPAHGEREGLVAVRRPTDREAAQVGAPEPGGSRLGLGDHSTGELHRVEPGIEGHVPGYDVADEVVALLVAGDGERRRGVLLEAQPGIEQRRVAAQPPGVSGHARPASRRPTARPPW